MQVIYTKYLGPTNYRGSRVKAYTCTKRVSVILPWNYSFASEAMHAAAAQALLAKLGWAGDWYQGDSGPDGGYVFVNVRRQCIAFSTEEGERE